MTPDKWDIYYLGLAQYVSTASKDPSTQVGAVIVGPHNEVIAQGFNGFPSSMPDDEALYLNKTEKLSRVIHAEMNALIYAARRLPEGSMLYTFPFIPCDRCVVCMLQAGIRRFVAPQASKEQNERWGESFAKTRKYIDECNGTLKEYFNH